MAAFDPRTHQLVEQRWFEDFRVGEVFRLPSRTMSDAHFLAFKAASGDNHPIHYDREFCRARGMPDLLAHGFQVLIQTAAGAGMLLNFLDLLDRGVEGCGHGLVHWGGLVAFDVVGCPTVAA